MTIWRVSLRPDRKMTGMKFRVELMFRNRPTHQEVLDQLRAKLDPDVILDSEPLVEMVLKLVREFPMLPQRNLRFWMPNEEGRSFSMDPMITNRGTTLYSEVDVVENKGEK